MIIIYYFFLVLASFLYQPFTLAQDTLPDFSVKNLGNKHIVIGWINNYPITKQINIQRSFDSLKYYSTILSVTDPTAVQNGVVDTKAPNDNMYYRLFINLDKGDFLFTRSKKPVFDTSRVEQNTNVRGTVAHNGKKTTTKPPDFIPSYYVYTNKDGYVYINLPDAGQKKYYIKFFEEDNSFLFEIKNIKERTLILDKANFLHAGWFSFELYNDQGLIEKNRLYLSKEF